VVVGAISVEPGGDLDRVIRPEIAPERLATGFRFVEGPSWNPAGGFLAFSDIIGDTLYRWDERGGIRRLRRPSHMANGTAWDREGRLLVCEHAKSRVSRVSADGRDYEVLVSQFEGKELNSPNDIVVSRDGHAWFTDPNSGRGAKYGLERGQELPFQGVYRLEPDSGALELLIDDFSKPNGLCLSRDESVLFVNDSDLQHIRRFEIRADGSVGGGEVWAETGGDQAGVADGMKLDTADHLYCCGSGGIHIFDPDGHRLGVLRLPEVAANFTWGGPDLCEMFVTATHSLYRLKTRLPGYRPFVPGAPQSPG
jgi:gluconolactonase